MHDVIEEFDRRCDQRSDIWEHLPTLKKLCEDIGARKIVELGTRDGNSTTAFLSACIHTFGHLWAVDVNPAPFEHTAMTFIRGDDRDPATLAAIPDEIDVLFIDTSHDYEHTMTELDLYGARVRPGGRIVLHDTDVRHPEGVPIQEDFPVRRAVINWTARHGFEWSENKSCNGLAVIEVD